MGYNDNLELYGRLNYTIGHFALGMDCSTLMGKVAGNAFPLPAICTLSITLYM